MSDFDRIFEPHYEAADLFTNRVTEHQAFSRSLVAHRDGVLNATAVLSQASRYNVLTFYGLGGIGKTELSHRLERWVLNDAGAPGDWGPAPTLEPDPQTARIDLHGRSTLDAADTVLRLRAAFAGIGKRFPAFDLGLAAWWALAHPGTPLPALHDARGFDLRGQMIDTLNEILADAGARFGMGPLTVRTGMRLVEAVRSRRLHSRALRECAPLVAILDQALRDPSPYVAATLAGLLSWDLERVPPSDLPPVVAFVDAAEYIQGGDQLQEKLLNRIVHLTPAILWVVTSRDALVWDSEGPASRLSATGPHVWPGLALTATDEPRQHRVGDLSDTDVQRYLEMASGSGGNPVLTPDEILQIRQGSHGLPLYLDLSMSLARAAARSGIRSAVLGGSLPDLVVRVFADLSDSERDMARSASLLRRFDAHLLAQATGSSLGDAQRFCRRSLVAEDTHATFPFRLHDAVRAAVTDEPESTQGAWAPADRSAQAERVLHALHLRHQQVIGDVDSCLDVVEAASSMCHAFEMKAPWLLDALTSLPGLRRTADHLPPPSDQSWIGQVSRMFDCWRAPDQSSRVARLERLAAEELPNDVLRAVRIRLAYNLRSKGDLDTSLRMLLSFLAETPDSESFRFQVANTLRMRGEYDALQRHVARHPLGSTSAAGLLRSNLAYDRGQLAEAIEGVVRRADHLRSVGRHRIALENEVLALWRSALAGHVTPESCDAAIAEADRHGVLLDMRTALAAKSVCLATSADAARSVLEEASAVINSGTGKIGWRERSSTLIYGLRFDDRHRIEEVRREWVATRPPWRPEACITDRLFMFAGYPPTYRPVETGDGIEEADVAQRWNVIFSSLLSHS
ncbi:hypothetical protein [Streptomyces chartreusis]